MAVKFRASVQHRKLSRLLRRLPEATTQDIKREIEAAATVVHRDAVNLAPVQDGVLRDNIGKRVSRSGFSAEVGILGKRAKKKAFYAHFVEFGTAPHNVAKGGGRKRFTGTPKGHPGTPAQPYLRPALEQNRKEISRKISGAVSRTLDKVSRG